MNDTQKAVRRIERRIMKMRGPRMILFRLASQDVYYRLWAAGTLIEALVILRANGSRDDISVEAWHGFVDKEGDTVWATNLRTGRVEVFSQSDMMQV